VQNATVNIEKKYRLAQSGLETYEMEIGNANARIEELELEVKRLQYVNACSDDISVSAYVCGVYAHLRWVIRPYISDLPWPVLSDTRLMKPRPIRTSGSWQR